MKQKEKKMKEKKKVAILHFEKTKGTLLYCQSNNEQKNKKEHYKIVNVKRKSL